MFNRPGRFNDRIGQQRPTGEGSQLRVILDAFDGGPAVGLERGAGLIGVDSSAPRPTQLAAFADFSRSGTAAEAAFWKIGTSLFRASAPQVLRDVRQEMGAGDGVATWTVDLLDRVSRRVQTINTGLESANRVAIPAPLSDGNDLSADWLALALWVVYGPTTTFGTRSFSDLALPRTVRIPRVGGAAWPSASGLVTMSPEFSTSALSPDPFVTRMPITDINGNPSSARKSPWPALGLLAVAAYAVSS